MKLTTANIQLPKGKADHIVFDDGLTGFGLRVRRGSGGRVIRNWVVSTGRWPSRRISSARPRR